MRRFAYSWRICVEGYSGNFGKLTVTLNAIRSSDKPPTDLLLVSPSGAEIVPDANVGDGSTVSGANITWKEAEASLTWGSPFTSGTFKSNSIAGAVRRPTC